MSQNIRTHTWSAIAENEIPRAANPGFQHLVDTYASESNKVASTWKAFRDTDLDFKPHDRSSSVGEIFRHQLLSERRFFGEFLQSAEPTPPIRFFPLFLPSNRSFSATSSWFARVLISSPRKLRRGGSGLLPSSMSSASGSGSSGAACCTPRTTAHNLLCICAYSIAKCRRHTVRPPMSPGPAPILRTRWQRLRGVSRRPVPRRLGTEHSSPRDTKSG